MVGLYDRLGSGMRLLNGFFQMKDMLMDAWMPELLRRFRWTPPESLRSFIYV